MTRSTSRWLMTGGLVLIIVIIAIITFTR